MKGETCIGIVFGVTNPSSHFFGKAEWVFKLGGDIIGSFSFCVLCMYRIFFFCKKSRPCIRKRIYNTTSLQPSLIFVLPVVIMC